MNQTRAESLAEALLNTLVGFFISLACNLWILPLCGVHVTFAQDLAMVGIFTLVSVVRGYVLRRFFNARMHQMAAALIQKFVCTK